MMMILDITQLGKIRKKLGLTQHAIAREISVPKTTPYTG